MNIKELLGQYEAKSKKAEEILAKGDGMGSADLADLRALNGELGGLKEQIAQAQEVERIKADQAKRQAELNIAHRPAPHQAKAEVTGIEAAGETIVDVKQKQLVDEFGEGILELKQFQACCEPEYKRAFYQMLRKGEKYISSDQTKALSEGVDTAGGYTVPEDLLARILSREATPTRVAGFTQRLRTSRDALVIPRVNYNSDDIYTTGIRAKFVGEASVTSSTHRATEPVFGQVRIPVWTCMLSLPVTLDLLEDSAFDLTAWIAAKFRETIDLLYDDKILNGSGIGEPAGVFLNPQSTATTDEVQYIPSGHASQLTADGLQDLVWSLPEQYDQNARLVFNKTNTGKAISKLKDSNNRYIWGLGLQDSGIAAAMPKQLVGYPYNFSGFAPNVGAGTFPIGFGDWLGYYLVERVGFSIAVVDQPYLEQNMKVLVGRLRFGGQLAEPYRLKVQKVATS